MPEQGGEANRRSGGAESFPDVLRRSIREGIAAIVGRDTAIAVEFYVDSSLAVKDISAYTAALQKLFAAGSKTIEERCAKALYSNLGLEFKVVEGFRLDDYVKAARTASTKKDKK
ncbi:MAG TPA: hypothetical protein VEO75_06155 [Nitrososphaerales archaeon]|nr:hypothetical protein [Nitrososphaerales archaeon]